MSIESNNTEQSSKNPPAYSWVFSGLGLFILDKFVLNSATFNFLFQSKLSTFITTVILVLLSTYLFFIRKLFDEKKEILSNYTKLDKIYLQTKDLYNQSKNFIKLTDALLDNINYSLNIKKIKEFKHTKDNILNFILSGSINLLPTKEQSLVKATIFIPTNSKKNLKVFKTLGHSSKAASELTIPIDSAAGYVYTTGNEYFCLDISTDPQKIYKCFKTEQNKTGSMICLPVKKDEHNIIAVLCLYADKINAFDTDYKDYLALFSKTILQVHFLENYSNLICSKQLDHSINKGGVFNGECYYEKSS